MKKYVIEFALVLALVSTYAVAQQSSGQPNPQGQAGSQAQPMGQQGYPQQQQPEAAPSQGTPQETPDKDRDQDRQAKKDKDKDKHKDKDKDKAEAASKSDETLEREVREQLSSNQEFQNVKVAVKDRVADLTGSVPKKEDRKEAVELARAVHGVKRVKEHLSVAAGGAAGAGTSASMEGKPGEEAHESAAEEARERQQNTAGSIAGNTSAAAGTQAGVAQPGTSAQSSSQVGDVSTRIQNVQQAIRNDAALAASNVEVSVVNNQIVLSGSVPSSQEKQRAEELAVAQAGGLQVINNINVSSSAGAAAAGATGGISGATTGVQQQPPSQSGATGAAVGAQTQGTTSSGAQGTTSEIGGMAPDQLKTQLQNAFQSEPTLSSCNITTNVTADSIELAGTCPTGKEKQTARRMAQSLAGNRRVVDRITVSGRGQGENEEKPQVPPQSPPPMF